MNLTDEIFLNNPDIVQDNTALIYPDKTGADLSYTYRQLYDNTCVNFEILKTNGLKPGDRALVLMDRVPALYFTALAIIKLGALYCPLFPSFGQDALYSRIKDSGGKFLITQKKYSAKVEPLSGMIEGLNIVYIDENADMPENFSGHSSYQVSGDEPAIIHYTSGTTGKPKGAAHCHRAVYGHKETGREVLKLKPGEIYWCTADPAWVTGTSYGITAPFACGVTVVACEAGYSAERFFTILEKYKVNILYTAPTLLRMMMREDDSAVRRMDLSSLKWAACVGEALTEDAVEWFRGITGLTMHNTWFQTETGSIMIANVEEDITANSGYKVISGPVSGNAATGKTNPGSTCNRSVKKTCGRGGRAVETALGKPVCGITAAIAGEDMSLLPPDKAGMLIIKPPWPSIFKGYWNDPERTKECFNNGWYLTGDIASVDQNGTFWFSSRADDIINTAGHLLSPVEVETVIRSHPSVEAVIVTGIPDEVAGEVVKARIKLKNGLCLSISKELSEDMEIEIRALVRRRLSPYASPRVIEFITDIPETESGKIMRRKKSSQQRQR